MISEIKKNYELILELNTQINFFLNNFSVKNLEEFNEKLQALINDKNTSIQNLILLKENNKINFQNAVKSEELKEIISETEKLEQENIRLIEEKKSFLSFEINKANLASKTLNAYKFKKELEPRIFDEAD